MRTIEEIQEEIVGQPSPKELADFKIELAGNYSFTATRLEEVLKKKPQVWIEIRKEMKSDAQADRHYELTDDGRDEIVYRLQLKKIEKLMSAISTKLRVAEGEARYQY